MQFTLQVCVCVCVRAYSHIAYLLLKPLASHTA